MAEEFILVLDDAQRRSTDRVARHRQPWGSRTALWGGASSGLDPMSDTAFMHYGGLLHLGGATFRMGADDGRLIYEISDFLAGKPVPAPAPDPIHPRRSRRRPRRSVAKSRWRRSRHYGPVVVVLLLITVAIVLQRGALPSIKSSGSSGAGTDRASTAPAGPGYAFLRLNPNGSPVRWNPCQAVHYRTNLSEAPTNAAGDLAGAIDRISEATGLRFINDGTTRVIPSTTYGVDSHLNAKPAVIAWATAAQTDGLGTTGVTSGLLTTHELGRGAAKVLIDSVTRHGVAVSGSVVIDADASRFLRPGFGTDSLGVVLMHELGHLVGLGHIEDPNDIMNPTITPTVIGTWSSGDLAGLARLGASSGCLTVPKTRLVGIY